jgi:hypothetical protein
MAGAALAAEKPAPYWPPITDPPTANVKPGKWVWAELLTRDVGTAAEFYGKVFGWTFETFGPKEDSHTYTLVSSQGTPIAGMVFVSPKDSSSKRNARWVGLISVDDVKVAEGRVVNGGGKVLMPPRQLGTRGTAALFADPEGAVFGVIRSATGDPDDYLGDEGSWLWNELWADDAAAMARFYQSIGGYEILQGAVAGEQTGFHLASGGYARAGILVKPIPADHTAWIPYIRVHSVEETVARARAAGGMVVIEPRDAHGTRAAMLVDPTGAPFAVAEWNRK